METPPCAGALPPGSPSPRRSAIAYKRSSVVVRGNVFHVPPTANPRIFALRAATRPSPTSGSPSASRAPVSAHAAHGPRASLEVRANARPLWPEAPRSPGSAPRTTVVVARTLARRQRMRWKGGDGRRGVRFPTGAREPHRRYRVAPGAPGVSLRGPPHDARDARPSASGEVTNPRAAVGRRRPRRARRDPRPHPRRLARRRPSRHRCPS